MADAETPEPAPAEAVARLIAAASFGRRVARVVVEFDDGRSVSADFPAPEGAEPLRLTPRELKVIELFEDLGPEDRLKGPTIARAANVQYGSIRKVLSALTKRGVLHSHGTDGGYSRGPKYPEVL